MVRGVCIDRRRMESNQSRGSLPPCGQEKEEAVFFLIFFVDIIIRATLKQTEKKNNIKYYGPGASRTRNDISFCIAFSYLFFIFLSLYFSINRP